MIDGQEKTPIQMHEAPRNISTVEQPTPTTRERTPESLSHLFGRYIRGATHMHTETYNPEGGLEATLSLEQQVAFLLKITAASAKREEFPLEFSTLTNHAEHLGLKPDQLTRWKETQQLTPEEATLVESGHAKRRIPKGDQRIPADTPGEDGWGLCTDAENSAMAKTAALQLREELEQIKKLREKYPNFALHAGVEASITPDGQLTIEDEATLKQLDVVIASPHAAGFNHALLAKTPETLIGIYEKVVTEQPVLVLGHPFIDKAIVADLVGRLQNAGWLPSCSVEQKTAIAKTALDPLVGNLLDLMREGKAAFELNLKSPMLPALQEAMIILLKEHQTPISIAIDGHQIQQWRTNPNQMAVVQASTEGAAISTRDLTFTQQELAAGAKFKENPSSLSAEERLQLDVALAKEKAIGTMLPLRLGRLLRQLDTHGIAANQVITSSEQRFQTAIQERKTAVA